MKQTSGVKGALDKYKIYLFASCSKENFKINQYQKFQPIRSMRFHFIWFLVNSIIPRVSHRPLYFVFIEVDFKKKKKKNIEIAANINISQKVSWTTM